MKLILTEDGSHTIYSEQFDEIYHSRHGALTESTHVFIQSGLTAVDGRHINIFEAGLGTGLNALLTWIYAELHSLHITYSAVELYPVSESLISEINFSDAMAGHDAKLEAIHHASWGQEESLSPDFSIQKMQQSLLDFSLPSASQNLIYFDAFSPDRQPELWTVEVFQKMYDLLAPNGILVTYCSKSAIRRNMQAAGFTVEKLQGPPGKREMVRARKAD